MLFVARAFKGLLMTTLAVAIIGYGVWFFQSAKREKISARAPQSERVFKVRSAVLRASHTAPQVSTFGRVKSWRRAPIVSEARGDVVWLSDNLRDGAIVEAGELLLRVDPQLPELALGEADAALREAVARQAEARESLAYSRADLSAAETMVDLRLRQLDRQQNLANAGSSSRAALDNVRMELASAEQAVATRRLSLVRAENELTYSALAIERAEFTLDRARRDLTETEINAPFAGVLASVDIALGRALDPNSVLAEIIDLHALEVEIDVTAADFHKLVDVSGQLRAQPVAFEQNSQGLVLKASGHLLRASANVGPAGSGRVLYASIDDVLGSGYRPGDFLSVKIEAPSVPGVAVVPSSALGERDQLLVVDADNRLVEQDAEVIGFLGDEVIVAEVPFGARYVTARLPQLGPGVKVDPVDEPRSGGLLSQDEPRRAGGDS